MTYKISAYWHIACHRQAVAAAGGIFLPETPNSLVERGYLAEARRTLEKVRGTKDVVMEFDTIVLANEALKGMENPWWGFMALCLPWDLLCTHCRLTH